MAETRYSILETQGQMCVSVSGYIIVLNLSAEFVPFFEQKIQGLFKDTFRIFQGLRTVQKKSNESTSFFSSSTSEGFYPEGLCVFFFFFVVLLKLLI